MAEEDTIVTVRRDDRPRCGAYELVRELGRGGMGSVWEGRHVTLGRRVAVKVLHEAFASNPELLARFLREGMAAARIDHPHVATVFDVGHEGNRAWLVMELLEGEDLGALLEREGHLDATRAADLLLPVIAALGTAHAAGVVHRDLKPGNLFLARDRSGVVSPKVVDFGFSKIREDTSDPDPELTRPDVALGTLSYMPAEQVHAASKAGPTCDQYALGVTLYRCVTGRLPYTGETPPKTFAAIVRGVCPRPGELVPGLPAGLDEVILQAMHRRPEGRFPSMQAFGAALLPFASPGSQARWSETFGGAGASKAATVSSPAPGATATPVAPGPAGASSGRARLVLGVALVLALVAVVTLALTR